MKGFHSCAASLLFLPASISSATETSIADTPPVHAVMQVVMQKCEGPAAVQTDAHPQRAEVQRSGLLPLGDLAYRVNLKRISDFQEWTVAVRLHDHSRQVDDSYVLFTQTGLPPFDAAYVVTRLPKAIADEGQALEVVLQMQKSSAGAGSPSFVRATTPLGEGLEMVVGGRVGSMCFPTSPFRYADTTQNGSIGISRFVVNDGDLIEYALVLPWPEELSQAEAIQRAQAAMNRFELGLEAVERKSGSAPL